MDPNTPNHDNRAEDRRILGQALRELRQRAGLTQEAVAIRAGTDNTYVSHAEAGRFGVGWDTVMRLLRAMDSTISDLAVAIEKQQPPADR